MGEKTYIHLSALGYTCIRKLGTSLESRIKKKERERDTTAHMTAPEMFPRHLNYARN